jgi:hypothetical protein
MPGLWLLACLLFIGFDISWWLSGAVTMAFLGLAARMWWDSVLFDRHGGLPPVRWTESREHEYDDDGGYDGLDAMGDCDGGD